ncbi:MAG: DUF309 domain-containing protein [Anaerolineaceae bacterium]|nr:DUF309 domain-containing protein [Anaerolineaceae bacterium]
MPVFDWHAMTASVVVIAGTPPWTAALLAQLPVGWTGKIYTQQAGYVPRLVDDGAALILVDGAAAEWRFWTATPKVSPATRRIPLIVISDDETHFPTARTAGADRALTSAALLAQLPALLHDFTRLPDTAQQTQIDGECQDALPPQALEGIALFNQGEYYRQHDVFEALWMATPGPSRNLYQGILQVGIAYYQITRGNQRGALKMLLRSVQWLERLPDVCQGVDVKQLREDSARVRAALEALPPANITAFDRSLLKPVRLVPG